MEIRPYIRMIHSSQYIDALANGEICIAVGWSGDILQARDRASEAGQGNVIKYFVPKEGTIIWFDMYAIPNDAPHPDNAHAFINFMMQSGGGRSEFELHQLRQWQCRVDHARQRGRSQRPRRVSDARGQGQAVPGSRRHRRSSRAC